MRNKTTSRRMAKGTLQFYKISTHVLLACMVISTICGIIIVSDTSKQDSERTIPTLKGFFGYPAWTSLPLLTSISVGYLTVVARSRKYLILKLVLDIINILARLAMIGFTSLVVITQLNSCVTKSALPERAFEYDDMGLGVPCDRKTIARVRLEFGLFIVIMIMESIAAITLFVSCVIFCTQCFRNCRHCWCWCTLRSSDLIIYHSNVENFQVGLIQSPQ